MTFFFPALLPTISINNEYNSRQILDEDFALRKNINFLE